MLANALRGHADVRITADAVVVTDPSGRETALHPLYTGAGFPQDVRGVLGEPQAHEDALVVVARRMSTGARTLLDDAGISWVDETGSARIAHGSLLVALDGAKPRGSEAVPAGPMRWAGASGAVAELVLDEIARRPAAERDAPLPRASDVADALGLSVPLVSRTLQRFDALGWTVKGGGLRGPSSTRAVRAPGEMLGDWASWHVSRKQESTAAHTLLPDLDRWLEQLRRRWPTGTWALTGEAAAEQRAPYLGGTSLVELYLTPDAYDDHLADLMDAAGLELVDSGARVRIRRADPYLLRRSGPHGDDGIPLVPDVRLYGDLLRGGVRGEDAATYLREQRIGF